VPKKAAAAERHRQRAPRGSLPFVYVPLVPKPKCACGSTSLRRYGYQKESDGAIWKHVECRDCCERFILVYEPVEPESIE
jgi:hypothetical protein